MWMEVLEKEKKERVGKEKRFKKKFFFLKDGFCAALCTHKAKQKIIKICVSAEKRNFEPGNGSSIFTKVN